MLEIKNVYKTYSSKNGVTHRALENVSLKFEDKGLVFILGKSGSGKSTLLNLIGGIDNFDRGDIIFNHKSFLSFKEKDYNNYRNSCVGFVFQDFNLLDNLTAYENVAIALDLQSKKDDQKILEMLKQMEVENVKNRPISDLSGGQKQRVAIARALIKDPKIILADEPTGSLDSETSDAIIQILLKLSKERLVIVVTHNKDLAYENGDRIIEIKDGFVLKDLMRKKSEDNEHKVPTLVSSSLVVIPANQKTNDEVIHDLNVTISEKRQDYYLMVEQNKHRVMSLYPNVSEVINDENKKETFIPYHYTVHEEKEVEENIQSNFPIKKAVKFSFTTFKKRKLKLFFTIILAIFSVIFTGTAINFTQYSLTGAISSSLSHSKKPYIEVASSFSISDQNYMLQKNDLDYLNTMKNEISYEYNLPVEFLYNSMSSTTNVYVNSALMTHPFLLNRTFNGFLTCDDISKYGIENQSFKIVYEKENISDEDYQKGVYISAITAHALLDAASYDNSNYYGLSTIADVVGKKFYFQISSFGTIYYQILGVFDINDQDGLYQRYSSILDGTADITLNYEFEEISKNILNRLVVSPSFMNNITTTSAYIKVPFETNSINNNLITTTGGQICSISNYKEGAGYKIHFVNGWNTDLQAPIAPYVDQLKDNQIIVGIDTFRLYVNKMSLTSSDYYDRSKMFNEMKKTLIVKNPNGNNNEIYHAIENVEIVGIIEESSFSVKKGIIVSKNVYQKLVNNYIRPNKALINISKENNLKDLIDNLYNHGFTIENRFVSYFNDFASTIEKYSSLIGIGVFVWFIFVTLLLYSFMSNTIKDSSKQIGILKALGANIKDIYKIYTVEAAIIGILACLFGISGYYFGGLLVNKIITDLLYTFYFPIFTCTFFIIFIMLFSTFIILLISLIIPMSRVKNIKPIDVINTTN